MCIMWISSTSSATGMGNNYAREELSLHTCTILYLFGFMQFGLFRSLSPAKLTLDQETGGFNSDS